LIRCGGILGAALFLAGASGFVSALCSLASALLLADLAVLLPLEFAACGFDDMMDLQSVGDDVSPSRTKPCTGHTAAGAGTLEGCKALNVPHGDALLATGSQSFLDNIIADCANLNHRSSALAR
jgi:hypothetical protein